MNTPKINWKPTVDYSTHRVEQRRISDLRPHERPSSWRIWTMAKLMRSGKEVPLIDISPDGTILDGHSRWFGARRVLGRDAMIPVQVKIR